MKILDAIKKFWYFNFANPVLARGEKGGFKWKFRRFWFECETLSGNFKARWTADEHPYGYLVMGEDDINTHGFIQFIYMVSKLLTTDQQFANDIQDAIRSLEKRCDEVPVVENEDEEKNALEEVKKVQEFVDSDEKEQKKTLRESEKRYKKAVKRQKSGK